MTLRVVETYVSYQGEGPNTTRPTVFVRFAGCNFKCPGWPCDTQHAIQPAQFTKLQKHYTSTELAEHVLNFGVDNICLTGGEVFLQKLDELDEFLGLMKTVKPHYTVECFTNGGLPWGDKVPENIDTFIVDWKLFGSGEEYEPNGVLGANLATLGSVDAIKFTIKDRADYEEALRRYKAHILRIDRRERPVVYAGVVWGALETEQLCDWMMTDGLDWRLNVQVHKYVWHPDKQGV